MPSRAAVPRRKAIPRTAATRIATEAPRFGPTIITATATTIVLVRSSSSSEVAAAKTFEVVHNNGTNNVAPEVLRAVEAKSSNCKIPSRSIVSWTKRRAPTRNCTPNDGSRHETTVAVVAAVVLHNNSSSSGVGERVHAAPSRRRMPVSRSVLWQRHVRHAAEVAAVRVVVVG